MCIFVCIIHTHATCMHKICTMNGSSVLFLYLFCRYVFIKLLEALYFIIVCLKGYSSLSLLFSIHKNSLLSCSFFLQNEHCMKRMTTTNTNTNRNNITLSTKKKERKKWNFVRNIISNGRLMHQDP